MPICLILEERINEGSVENGAEEDKEEEDNGIKEEIIIWNKEVIESYKKNTEIIKDMANDIRNEGKDVEDMWEEIKQIVFNNVVKKKKIKKKKRRIRYKDWWDINRTTVGKRER